MLGFPFHFLNNNHAMNLKPKNYEWIEFYDRVIDLTQYSFSKRAVWRRLRANRGGIPRLLNAVRALSSEGNGRIAYYTTVRDKLRTDRKFRDYFEGETQELPQFFIDRVKHDLGPLWEFLPEGALEHDPYAYLKRTGGEGARAGAGRSGRPLAPPHPATCPEPSSTKTRRTNPSRATRSPRASRRDSTPRRREPSSKAPTSATRRAPRPRPATRGATPPSSRTSRS